MSLKKRIFSNGLASILQKGIRVLEQLFLVPFFITAWGAAYYGEWLTLTIIPTVIAFSDLGFGTASANSFVLSYAAGKKQKAADISKTGMRIITIMVISAMVLSTLVIAVLNYFEVFDKTLIDKHDAIIAVIILIFARLLNFYTQLIESYYRSAQKAALSINLLTIKAGLNLLGGLIVLLAGYGVIEFALSQLIVILFFNIYYLKKGKKILNVFSTYTGNYDVKLKKEIVNKGLSYLMSPVWQMIYFQGTTFVVRIVLGPEAVAIFNTVRTLSRSLNQIFFMIKGTVYPELQFEVGQENWKTARKVFRVALVGVFLMSFIGFLFLLIFGRWFYNVWTQNQLEISNTMWYIFISGMLFNAVWWTAEMVFGIVNEPKKIALNGIITSIISVALTYILANQFNLIGAAIGAVSLDIILFIWVLPNSCKIMGTNLTDLLKYGFKDIYKITSGFYTKIKTAI